MVYPFLKIFARIAVHIFCADIVVNKKHLLKSKGPILITANHPDSFLDAIILAVLFEQPIYSLARGDAFKKKWHNSLLSLLNMIPIYRLSEGKENLHLNQATFVKSKDILSKNGIVLIFIEGLCEHEYGLRPFKKGAARIAQYCVAENIPLKVMPLGLNYTDFRKTGVHIDINIGKVFDANKLLAGDDEAKQLLSFNNLVKQELEQLVWKENKEPKKKANYWLFPFAIPGFLLNAPLYYPVKSFVDIKTKRTVFYHAVLLGLLFFTYPLYVMLISIILLACGAGTWVALSAFILLPLTAYITIQLKKSRY